MIISSNNLYNKTYVSMKGPALKQWADTANVGVKLDTSGLFNNLNPHSIGSKIEQSSQKLTRKIESLNLELANIFESSRPWTKALDSPERTAIALKIERLQNARVSLYKLKERLGLT